MHVEKLDLNATDPKGRPLPASFINYWNNTTAAEVENEKLKQQIDALIIKESKIEEVIKKIEPQYQFFTKPTIPSKKKPTKQELIDKIVAEKLKERELKAKIKSNKKGA